MSAKATGPFDITACRGVEAANNCRFAMGVSAGLLREIELAIADSGWPEFLRTAISGPLLHHHAFKISVAACPNGCSRPHVADVGIIRACAPMLDPEPCNQCRICEKSCPDKAITMDAHGPMIDFTACMQCGLCVARCPERALTCGQSGFRIVLGGKLGRHPRLATPFPGIHATDRVPAIVARCLDFYMRHYRRGLRFGTLVEEQSEVLLEELDNT